MKERRGIPNGTLWGLLIFVGYIWSYLGLGLWFVWQSATPENVAGWFKLMHWISSPQPTYQSSL